MPDLTSHELPTYMKSTGTVPGSPRAPWNLPDHVALVAGLFVSQSGTQGTILCAPGSGQEACSVLAAELRLSHTTTERPRRHVDKEGGEQRRQIVSAMFPSQLLRFCDHVCVSASPSLSPFEDPIYLLSSVPGNLVSCRHHLETKHASVY